MRIKLMMAIGMLWPAAALGWWSVNIGAYDSTHLRLTTGSLALLSASDYPDMKVMFGSALEDWSSNADNDLAAHGGSNTTNRGPVELWQANALSAYATGNLGKSLGSAYYYVGLLTHLVEDRAVPSHAAEIAHGELGNMDNMEEMAFYHFEALSASVVETSVPYMNYYAMTEYTRAALADPTWRQYWILGEPYLLAHTGRYGGVNNLDAFPTRYSNAGTQEQYLLRQQLGAAQGYTAGMLASMSRLFPPLVRTALSISTPVISTAIGNPIAFKVIENRTRNVLISLVVEDTGQPIVDADGNTWDERPVVLGADSELPWGAALGLVWKGEVVGAPLSSGSHSLRLKVWDSETPRNMAPDMDNDHDGIQDTLVMIVMPCGGVEGWTCTVTPTATWTATCTVTPTETPTGTWYTSTPTPTPTDTLTPTPTGSATATPSLDAGLTVWGNRFNPLGGESAKISFKLNAPSRATLSIYNSSGERVAVLWDGPVGTESRFLAWDGKNRAGQFVSSGFYLVTLSTSSGNFGKKVMVLKR